MLLSSTPAGQSHLHLSSFLFQHCVSPRLTLVAQTIHILDSTLSHQPLPVHSIALLTYPLISGLEPLKVSIQLLGRHFALNPRTPSRSFVCSKQDQILLDSSSLLVQSARLAPHCVEYACQLPPTRNKVDCHPEPSPLLSSDRLLFPRLDNLTLCPPASCGQSTIALAWFLSHRARHNTELNHPHSPSCCRIPSISNRSLRLNPGTLSVSVSALPYEPATFLLHKLPYHHHPSCPAHNLPVVHFPACTAQGIDRRSTNPTPQRTRSICMS